MDFTWSVSGNVVVSASGAHAFVPHPLPPTVEWDNQLVSSVARANFSLGRLAREAALLTKPPLLLRTLSLREAVWSCRIEGIKVTLADVLAHDVGATVTADAAEIQDVQNYCTALDFSLTLLNALPFSLRLIKETHEHLMQGARGANATPGEFRKIQNWLGPPGSTLATATFVPPPVDFLLECLSDFEHYLHERTLSPLIHVALCHYQFEAIHPFADGNGRIGRLLNSLLMIKHQVLPAPLLSLSAYFEATRDDYFRHLYSVSKSGTWNQWLSYFLNGITVQAMDVLSRIERILALVAHYKQTVARTNSSIPVMIVEQIAQNPFFTVKHLSHVLGIAFSTAQRGVQRLEMLGMVQEITKGKRDKVYCAQDLLAILEEAPVVRL